MTGYDSYSDEGLLSALRSGEREAFDEIYERYWDKLFVVAAYRLGNPAEAEEVVQDVMLGLWTRRNELNLHSELSAYLSVAVKYEVINRLAKLKRLQEYRLAAQLPEADHTTEQSLELSALQDRLALLVKALPEKCRLVFILSREQGLSQKEIASQLRISENTVESHLKRAIKALRAGLRLILFTQFY